MPRSELHIRTAVCLTHVGRGGLAETAILAGDSETARAAFEDAYDLYLRSDFSLKAVAVAQMLVRLERFSAGAYL